MELKVALTSVLELMGVSENEIRSVSKLNGGASGSYVYMIELEGERRVLKFTEASSANYVYERALREYRFYQEFGEWLPALRPEPCGFMLSDIGVGLLLPEYLAPEKTQWTKALLDVTLDALSDVHASYWGETNRLSHIEWFAQPRNAVSDEEKAEAICLWEQALKRLEFSSQELARVYSMLKQLILSVDSLLYIKKDFPKCLCHGDFHIGNLLTTPLGDIIIADWQEVKIGRGPEDVAFFLQRAETSGFDIEREYVITTYADLINKKVQPHVDRKQVQRIITASELITILLEWPFYLQYLNSNKVQGLLERVEIGASRFGLT